MCRVCVRVMHIASRVRVCMMCGRYLCVMCAFLLYILSVNICLMRVIMFALYAYVCVCLCASMSICLCVCGMYDIHAFA